MPSTLRLTWILTVPALGDTQPFPRNTQTQTTGRYRDRVARPTSIVGALGLVGCFPAAHPNRSNRGPCAAACLPTYSYSLPLAQAMAAAAAATALATEDRSDGGANDSCDKPAASRCVGSWLLDRLIDRLTPASFSHPYYYDIAPGLLCFMPTQLTPLWRRVAQTHIQTQAGAWHRRQNLAQPPAPILGRSRRSIRRRW